MNTNSNLHTARSAKDDEFYTTFNTVEEELFHYASHFYGKVVYCNCDDPYKSNFFKYFARNFNSLGLKKLIATCYNGSAASDGQFLLDDVLELGESDCNGKQDSPMAYKAVISEVNEEDCDGGIDLSDIEYLVRNKKNTLTLLEGNGDFRSGECVELLRESDIVVTNPPFSLFGELVSLLVEHHKNYLLIGSQNALTYKEIFLLIKNNLAWTGYRFGEMKFRVPSSSEPRQTRYWVDESGQKWRSLGNAMWLTNLDIERRHKHLKLTCRYSPEKYPRYDSYDAIHVKTVAEIPYDFPGTMGVPVTIVDKYNSEQFEILGEAKHGSDNEYDLFKPTIKGKEFFMRILIRNRLVSQDGV